MKNFTKIGILFFLLGFQFKALSQKKLNYSQANTITYNQYLKGNWKELIKTGKEYLKYGESFYYLQIRMGIAYYKQKKYRKAISYLSKAYKANPKNTVVNEYLYYAYIFSARTMDAQKLSANFSLDLKKKLGIDYDKFIDALTFDVRFENNDDYFKGLTTGEILQQDVRTGYSFYGIGVEHVFGGNKRLYWNYSNINQGINVYDNDDNKQTSDDKDITQNQFYISYYTQIKYGFNVSFALNYLNIITTGHQLISRGGMGGMWTRTISTKYTTNEFVGFFAVHKDFSDFRLGLGTSASNLNNTIQLQPGIDFVYYPLSNTNLYFMFNADYQLDINDDTVTKTPIIKPAVGVKLFKLYLEASYTWGDIYNYIENNALIINNDTDLINDRIEFKTYLYLFKGKINLFLKYQQYNKSNIYNINNNNQTINYFNQSYTGGIKWNF